MGRLRRRGRTDRLRAQARRRPDPVGSKRAAGGGERRHRLCRGGIADRVPRRTR